MPKPVETKMRRAERLVRWAVFSVLVSLLPLAFVFVDRLMEGHAASLVPVLGQGQLLLISAALAASAIGELIARGTSQPVLKVLAAGGAVTTVLASSYYFARVSGGSNSNPDAVLWVSMVLFALSVVASAGCIALSEEA